MLEAIRRALLSVSVTAMTMLYQSNVLVYATVVTGLSDYELKRIRFYETNFIAELICKVVEFATGDFAHVAVTVTICVVGYASLQGGVQLYRIVRVAVGITIVTMTPTIIGILLPTGDIVYGCKCRTQMPIGRDSTGQIVYADLELNSDCTVRK